jgi:D-3-phosphoglycerate dehydrogenase
VAAHRAVVFTSRIVGQNSIAVAELAFALILALDRRVAGWIPAVPRMNKGAKARGLFGGRWSVGVGKLSGDDPRQSLGMPVVAESKSHGKGRAISGTERDAAEVARAAYRRVHVALKPDTRMLIGPEFFGAMNEAHIS